MKKLLFLLVAIPLIAQAQSTLVSWNVTNWPYPLTPSIANGQNLGATGLTFVGINTPTTGDSNGVYTTTWPSESFDSGKYVQFTISSYPNNTVTINGVNFDYRGNAKGHRILYSKDNFATTLGNGYDYTVNNDGASQWSIYSNNQTFSTPITLNPGQTLKVRIYAATGNNRYIKNITVTGSSTAPTGFSGTYHVGAAQPSPFNTLTNAANAISGYGVTGAVTLLLDDDTYSNSTGEVFPVTFNTISGTSASKTVTIKPAPSKTVLIEASNVNDNTGIPAVFYLLGSDYVIFDGSNVAGGTTQNLTIDNTDYVNSVQRSVIRLASNGTNGATNVTVKNTKIKMGGVKNQGGKFAAGVYSGASGIEGDNSMVVAEATANNSNLTVTNNDFINVKQGVYVNGGSTVTTNVTVKGNDLGSESNTETIIQPGCFNNVNTFEYSSNYIYNLYRETADGGLVSSGITIIGNTSNGTIVKNQMRNLRRTFTESVGFAGIYLTSTNTNSNILIANNFVNNVVGNGNGSARLNGHGIYVGSGGGYKIYNNTVYLNDNQPQGGYSAALFVDVNVNTLDVRNNMFINNQTNTATRRTAITIVKNASQLNTVFPNGLDYNDYYSNDRIGYVTNQWNASDVSSMNENNPDYIFTLSTWKSTTNKDANSIDALPEFTSATDLHINPYSATIAQYNNKGTNALLTTVPKDIDGQLRNTTTPDMGADEFGPLTMPEPGTDAGIYCDASTTWNGTSWSNGNPLEMAEEAALAIDVIFNADFTQTGGTFNACSIFVEAGADVDFTNQANAVVKHNVNVATGGSLTFESDTTLRQLEDDANTGIVTIKRYGSKLKRLDYTIWSAPVYDYRGSSTEAGQDFQSLADFSPLTSTSPIARFYVYNTLGNAYESVNPTTSRFEQGKGYLIRMPNQLPFGDPNFAAYNAGNYRYSFLGVFEGTPNNGDVRIGLDYQNSNLRYNMVGNPYPSPISVKAFIDENSENIEGTLYLWRKTNNAAETSYSTITKLAYVANMALGGGNSAGDGNDGNNLIGDPFILDVDNDGELDPIVNTGQGFIVASKNSNDLVFKNNMRLSHNYNNFFRNGNPQAVAPVSQTFSRYWINVKNSSNSFAQMAVGYGGETSTGYDNGYDGKLMPGGPLSVYAILNNAEEAVNLAIEARGAFDVNDAVTLGFRADVAGQYEISLDHFDGLFTNEQAIYIVDNLTGNMLNLKNGAYSFTTEAGTFDNRFNVVYTNQAELGTDVPAVNTKEVIVYRDGNQINIAAPQNITSVAVYDMLGRELYNNNSVSATDFQATLTTAQQVVIVRMVLENQQIVSKKIMMN